MADLVHTQTVSIYGTGALGRSLAIQLYKKGFEITSLINRTIDRAKEIENVYSVSAKHVLKEPLRNEHIGNVLFLTVTDDKIVDVASSLARKNISFSHKTVVHCSGVLNSAVLRPLKREGASIVAMHPVQTFGGNSENPFRNIYFSLEGDDQAVSQMAEIATALDAHSIKIKPEAKPYIHAAAAVASNYLVTLMHQAGRIAMETDIEKQDALKMLKPLIQTTFDNVINDGAVKALTGPIARGDIETIKKHIELLENDPALFLFYTTLGIHTCNLALEKERSKYNEIKIIQDLLTSLHEQQV